MVFRILVKNKSLSKYEKVGFPESYRKGIEAHIYSDICKKVTNILNPQGNLMDISPSVVVIFLDVSGDLQEK